MTLKGLNSHHLKAGEAEPAAPGPGQARLYNMKFCPFAERVVIYLARKGINTEIINIDLKAKPEWYFRKHYQGKVPTFEHDGKVVIESLVIPEYLDDAFPNTPRILPADPYEKALQKLIVERLSVVFQAFIGLVGGVKDDSQMPAKLEEANKTFAEVESLLTHDFFTGKEPGFPDYMVYPFFERIWLLSKAGKAPIDAAVFPGKDFPKLHNWFETMFHRPEIQAAMQPLEVSLEYFRNYLTGGPLNYDINLKDD